MVITCRRLFYTVRERALHSPSDNFSILCTSVVCPKDLRVSPGHDRSPCHLDVGRACPASIYWWRRGARCLVWSASRPARMRRTREMFQTDTAIIISPLLHPSFHTRTNKMAVSQPLSLRKNLVQLLIHVKTHTHKHTHSSDYCKKINIHYTAFTVEFYHQTIYFKLLFILNRSV